MKPTVRTVVLICLSFAPQVTGICAMANSGPGSLKVPDASGRQS